jgi:hypothetical protein
VAGCSGLRAAAGIVAPAFAINNISFGQAHRGPTGWAEHLDNATEPISVHQSTRDSMAMARALKMTAGLPERLALRARREKRKAAGSSQNPRPAPQKK